MRKKADVRLTNRVSAFHCNFGIRAELTNIGCLGSVILPQSCSGSGTLVPGSDGFI